MFPIDRPLLFPNQPVQQAIVLVQIGQTRHIEVVGPIQDCHGDVSIDRLQLLGKLQAVLRFYDGVRRANKGPYLCLGQRHEVFFAGEDCAAERGDPGEEAREGGSQFPSPGTAQAVPGQADAGRIDLKLRRQFGLFYTE